MIKLDHRVGSKYRHTLNGVRLGHRSVKQVKTVTNCGLHLKSTQRLTHVDWKGDASEILANRVFNDRPNTELDLRVFEEWKSFSRWRINFLLYDRQLPVLLKKILLRIMKQGFNLVNKVSFFDLLVFVVIKYH